MNHKITAAVLLLLVAITYNISGTAQTAQDTALAAINIQAAKAHIGFLASDSAEGRQSGTRGAYIAGEYITANLRMANIEPLLPYDYRQSFEVADIRLPREWLHSEGERAQGQRAGTLHNILAKIEGKDKSRAVVIGAHYDHIGKANCTMSGDGICNGADDNASGVQAVLQIAAACKKSGLMPDITIIFAFWDGEELGMFGSRHFVGNIPDSLQVVGYINFDMIGRNHDETKPQEVSLLYSQEQPQFRDWFTHDIETYNLRLQPLFKPSDSTTGGSDNAPFQQKGIPMLWYHTEGHVDVHCVTDEADRINYDKATEITKAGLLALWRMAGSTTKD